MPKIRVKTDRIEVETEVVDGNYNTERARIMEIIREVGEQHQKIAKSESNQNT